MKKVFCLFLSFFSIFCASSKENLDFVQIFEKSGIFEKNKNQAELDKNIFLDYKNFFLPSFDFNFSGSYLGEFESANSSTNLSPTFTLNQNLPGGAIFKIGSDYSLDVLNLDWDVNHTHALNPFASFEIPLIFDKKFFRENVDGSLKYAKFYEKFLDADYKLKNKENLCDFVNNFGNFLYYLELKKVLREKNQILNLQEENFEKMILTGKVSAMEVSEKIKSNYENLKEISENENNILKSKENLILMDLKFDLENESENILLKDFLLFWLNILENENKNENDFLFLSENYELSLLDKNYYENVRSSVKNLPSFTTDFFLQNESSSFSSFPDFKNAVWKAKISVNIPISFGNNIFLQGKNQSLKRKIYFFERERIYDKISLKSEKISSVKKIYSDYILNLLYQLKIEEKRTETYEKLLEMGKISKLDLEFQKNQKNLSECYFYKAKLDYICALLENY